MDEIHVFILYSGKASYGMVEAILHQSKLGDFIIHGPQKKHGRIVGYRVQFNYLTPKGEILYEKMAGGIVKLEFLYRQRETSFWYIEKEDDDYVTALVIPAYVELSTESQ